MANITKEFLEGALGAEIDSFEVNPGSNAGDNYASVLHAIQVKLTKEKSIRKFNDRETLHLLLKCFPSNAARQDFLTVGNIFLVEMKVYDTLIPELVRFQKEILGEKQKSSWYKPPFPEYFHGRTVDYSQLEKGAPRTCNDVLENYIIMGDLRKDGSGFRLANRLVGFDLDHSKLVFQAQAKLHALGWAYKQRTDTLSLNKKFPFLANNPFDELGGTMMEIMTANNIKLFKSVINGSQNISEERKQELSKSLDRFQKLNYDLSLMYFSESLLKDPSLNKDNVLRVPRPSKEDEEPWKVLTHGDCWLNNMLFKYDEKTGKPLEVILVDLQMMREGDPFADIAYNTFTSTTAEFRKENIEFLLKLYTDTFLQVCHDFGVKPLPGFSLEEVKRRFGRAKAFGLTTALMGLPVFLLEKKDVVDMEKLEGEGMQAFIDQFAGLGKNMKGNTNFSQRVIGLVTELYDDGVI